MSIPCEFQYCVYQAEGECKLGNIRIDSAGMCSEGMFPPVPAELLNLFKENWLRRNLEK